MINIILVYLILFGLILMCMLNVDTMNYRSQVNYAQVGGSSTKTDNNLTNTPSVKIENKTNEKTSKCKLDQKIKNAMIPQLSLSSNNVKIALNVEYGAEFAQLDSNKSWSGDPKQAHLSYLQVKFPGYFHVTGIITKGRSGSNEWVTRYYLEYWDRYKEKWVKFDQILVGNQTDDTPTVNRINLNSNKIRIYPVKWHKNPSLRVAFIGERVHFSKCRYYKMKMKTGNSAERKNYHQLYQQKCLKIPKETFDQVVDNLRQKEKTICLDKIKMSELEKSQQELNALKKKCCLVATEFKHLKKTSCPRDQLIDLANSYRSIVKHKQLKPLK